MHSWYLSGLDPHRFQHLFGLSDRQLADVGAIRRFATEATGFPCRVSLEDAQVGDELLLLCFEHHASASPYRACGPIFVRRSARRCVLPPGELAPCVSSRQISARAYDAAGFMLEASVCAGTAVATELDRVFADPNVAYVHLHNARPGCFSCRASRVASPAVA